MKKLIIAAIIILTAGIAFGATYYVDPAASGSNNGSDWTNAYTSMPTPAAGNIYWIADGSYSFSMNDTTASYKTIKKCNNSGHNDDDSCESVPGYSTAQAAGHFNGQATFSNISASGDYYVFDGNTVKGEYGLYATCSSSQSRCVLVEGENWEIKGLEIDASSLDCSGDEPALYLGTYSNVSNNVNVYNVWTHGSCGDCFRVTRLTNYSIDNSLCNGRRSIGSVHGDFIQIYAGVDGTISNNFVEWSGQGVFFGGEPWGAMGTHYIYNNVFNCQDMAGSKFVNAQDGASGGPLYIYGNSVLNPYTEYINTKSVSVAQNSNNIYICEGTAKGLYGGNYSYNAVSSGCSISQTNGQIVTSSIFVNASNSIDYPSADFHLNTETNTGATLGSPYNVDKDGYTRGGINGIWSRGAYEYDPSGALPGDTTPPTVTAFTIPSTATTLTFGITAFTATDAVGVTGYCINEVSAAPTSSACSGSDWEASAQTTYTVTSAGTYTLYAWAKDAVGNVSSSLNGSITIAVPAPPTRVIFVD